MSARQAEIIRFGTSSFSSPDWVGPFYPQGTRPSDFLRFYSGQYDTVEVDATYYRTPDLSTADHWAELTPEGFVFSLKFPRSIVHGGEGAQPDGAKLLSPDATYAERDRFLRVAERLQGKCGPLLLQFPYLAKRVFASASEFLERLDGFLADLPRDRRYAVEIRNKSWLSAPLSTLCRRYEAALVMSDQAWMPRPWEVTKGTEWVTTDFSYVRLLGDRQKIEALTKTWGRVVVDRESELSDWADYLALLAGARMPTFVYINNHFAGFAPGTLERLKTLFRERARAAST